MDELEYMAMCVAESNHLDSDDHVYEDMDLDTDTQHELCFG
jgi:hypothetical protein